MAFFLMDHLVQGGPKKLDQNLQTFDISHTFLALTAAKLSCVKNGPPCIYKIHLLPSVITQCHIYKFPQLFFKVLWSVQFWHVLQLFKKTVLFLLAHPVCRCKSSLQGAISVWSGSVVTLFSLTEAVC